MAERVALYVLWALLGTAASFVAMYAFTPLGLPFLALVYVGARGLAALSGPDAPDLWGAIAGPGIFLLVLAGQGDGQSGDLVLLGSALVAISAAAFLLAGSRRCRRGAYG